MSFWGVGVGGNLLSPFGILLGSSTRRFRDHPLRGDLGLLSSPNVRTISVGSPHSLQIPSHPSFFPSFLLSFTDKCFLHHSEARLVKTHRWSYQRFGSCMNITRLVYPLCPNSPTLHLFQAGGTNVCRSHQVGVFLELLKRTAAALTSKAGSGGWKDQTGVAGRRARGWGPGPCQDACDELAHGRGGNWCEAGPTVFQAPDLFLKCWGGWEKRLKYFVTRPAFSEAGSVAWGRRLWGRLPGFHRMASAGFRPLRRKKRLPPLKLFKKYLFTFSLFHLIYLKSFSGVEWCFAFDDFICFCQGGLVGWYGGMGQQSVYQQ